MGCTHPLGVDKLIDDQGKFLGVRCPVCGSASYAGESLWAALKRRLLTNQERTSRGR